MLTLHIYFVLCRITLLRNGLSIESSFERWRHFIGIEVLAENGVKMLRPSAG